MTNNPYFLPERDPSNCAITLLSNTVGYDNLPINVFDIPEQEDYEVLFCNDVFDNDNQYGLSIIKSEDDKVIFLNSDFYGNSFDDVIPNDTKRRHCRFTLAHELGHCTIPEHKDLSLRNTLLNENNTHYKKYNFQREYEANVFAAELLIPSVAIKNIYSYGKNFKEIVANLSNKFDASVMASALRTANLMNDSICICLQINKQSKKIINFRYSNAFKDYKRGLFIEKNTEPYSGSVANSLIKGTTICTYQYYNNPSDWFPNFYGSQEAKLHEWSFDMGENIITFLELIDTSDYNLYF